MSVALDRVEANRATILSVVRSVALLRSVSAVALESVALLSGKCCFAEKSQERVDILRVGRIFWLN